MAYDLVVMAGVWDPNRYGPGYVRPRGVDGVTFHISTPESKTKILVSLHIKCFKELVQYGAQAVLEREYGPYIVEPESGYDFSVLVDLENLPEEQGTVGCRTAGTRC